MLHRLRASGVTSMVSSWFAGMVVSCPVGVAIRVGFSHGFTGVWCFGWVGVI